MMVWICEDCDFFAATDDEAGRHSDRWRHSLAVCPEERAAQIGMETLDRLMTATPVRAIRHSRLVPLGRVMRQWDTKGHLHLWINTASTELIPVVQPKPVNLREYPVGIIGVSVYDHNA